MQAAAGNAMVGTGAALASEVDEPEPFSYLGTQSSAFCRDVMRAFARAKERFVVHLRPEDVAAELGLSGDEGVGAALEQLAK